MDASASAGIPRPLRLTERLDERALIEADIQEATAILREPNVWKRDGKLAHEALLALWEVYGFEALCLATH
jgi:hypothetical protein